MIDNKSIDYKLYLVTDSTLLPDKTTLESQVEKALQNGVTLVQLREKEADTRDFVEQAQRIKNLCSKYSVPLIINDRVDVALAVDADGVHVGQDDMPVPMVRKLIGPDKIIGWSVSKIEEVDQIAEWGPQYVDYIGIGTVFATNTKKNIKKSPMGPAGVATILDRLELKNCNWCRTVVIGGLHAENVGRVLYQSQSSNGKRSPDGISVVSDIISADDAGEATKILRRILDSDSFKFVNTGEKSVQKQEIIEKLSLTKPLLHHITNRVHQNFGANIALALGGSPIMSEVKEEFHELSAIPNSCLILNTGSTVPLDVATHAVKTYNLAHRPIVLDPVGIGASQARMRLNTEILNAGQFSCIKGNSGEILCLSGVGGKMKGVDSGEESPLELRIQATKIVAHKYRTIVVCTDRIDIVADGTHAFKSRLGTGINATIEDIPYELVESDNIELFESITASGCSLGTTIAAFIGAAPEQVSLFSVVKYAVETYKAAGWKASSNCNGSGSFQVELLDNLYRIVHD